jgi:hypothetical protein
MRARNLDESSQGTRTALVLSTSGMKAGGSLSSLRLAGQFRHMRREFKRPSVSWRRTAGDLKSPAPSWPDTSYTVSLNGNVSLKEVY